MTQECRETILNLLTSSLKPTKAANRARLKRKALEGKELNDTGKPPERFCDNLALEGPWVFLQLTPPLCLVSTILLVQYNRH
ncbi:hypothetical protein J6590_018352 [Homalodisca vitripennis]|nr:hypothetical protein J6590_018352 [Homalodisca vitripennis]